MAFLKKYSLLLIILFITNIHAQERVQAKFGSPTPKDLGMKYYSKIPDAKAVILYESGHNSIEFVGDYLKVLKKVHRKIKVFEAKNFDGATINIPYYRTDDNKEKVKDLKAVTHNGALQTYLNEDNIFDVDDSEHWSEIKFTFPNVKDGSVLEYTYTIESPFYYNFGGWEFEEELPKIYSEFETQVPGNFVYKKLLYGNLPLSIKETSLMSRCLVVNGSSKAADCEVSTYAMKDIPAFKEENYMLAKSNYISRVDYELDYYIDFQGFKNKHSKEWKDVDKNFRTDKNVGRQLKKTSYFDDKMPEDILSIKDDLEKAKAIYYFIQDHYTWNGNYRLFSDVRVKDAFEEKKGNSTEINISLINSLEASGLEVKPMLISTRQHGVASLEHPMMSNFNFLIAYLTINNKNYVLDATEKQIPFGILPFRDLNTYGRVMDFDNESFWYKIKPNTKNVHYINAQINVDEDGYFKGNTNEIHAGYMGVSERKKLSETPTNDYIKEKQNTPQGIEISNYKLESLNDLEKPLKENYEVLLETETVGNKTLLYPFFMKTYFDENPLKDENRNYPIDFGFPITNTYLVSIDLKGMYEVETLPENKIVKLPEDAGECSVVYEINNGKINAKFNFKLNAFYFNTEEYKYLQKFFETVINMQTKEPIVLKKV